MRDFKIGKTTYSYKLVALPKSEWHDCECKKHDGMRYMERNLHESAGWIPCDDIRCFNGTIKQKWVKIYNA